MLPHGPGPGRWRPPAACARESDAAESDEEGDRVQGTQVEGAHGYGQGIAPVPEGAPRFRAVRQRCREQQESHAPRRGDTEAAAEGAEGAADLQDKLVSQPQRSGRQQLRDANALAQGWDFRVMPKQEADLVKKTLRRLRGNAFSCSRTVRSLNPLQAVELIRLTSIIAAAELAAFSLLPESFEPQRRDIAAQYTNLLTSALRSLPEEGSTSESRKALAELMIALQTPLEFSSKIRPSVYRSEIQTTRKVCHVACRYVAVSMNRLLHGDSGETRFPSQQIFEQELHVLETIRQVHLRQLLNIPFFRRCLQESQARAKNRVFFSTHIVQPLRQSAGPSDTRQQLKELDEAVEAAMGTTFGQGHGAAAQEVRAYTGPSGVQGQASGPQRWSSTHERFRNERSMRLLSHRPPQAQPSAPRHEGAASATRLTAPANASMASGYAGFGAPGIPRFIPPGPLSPLFHGPQKAVRPGIRPPASESMSDYNMLAGSLSSFVAGPSSLQGPAFQQQRLPTWQEPPISLPSPMSLPSHGFTPRNGGAASASGIRTIAHTGMAGDYAGFGATPTPPFSIPSQGMPWLHEPQVWTHPGVHAPPPGNADDGDEEDELVSRLIVLGPQWQDIPEGDDDAAAQ